MKRVALFLATNVAVLLVLGIVLGLLGVDSLLDEQGVDLDLASLLVFSAVFGMGGSFLSLALSRWMAKRTTGAQVIDPNAPRNDVERWLLQKVGHLSQAAGIRTPEVAIFPSDSPNAFATGARRNAALVAVSTGLLKEMNPEEVEAVLGHEIGHVSNGDMVTLTLIQGVVNTFVLFFSRVIGHTVDRVVFRTERGHGPAFYITSILAQVLLSILASIIVLAFSRAREFRADAAGARLVGRREMIAALERLRGASERTEPLPEQMAAFGIAGGSKLGALFATHPPLEARIERLRAGG